jgi:hypothetical protein
MEIIRLNDGQTPMNFISIIKNGAIQHHFYYKTLNAVTYGGKYYMFDSDIDTEFISDLRNDLGFIISKKHYFLIHDSLEFKMLPIGNQLLNLFFDSNNFININAENFIPTFNIIRQNKSGFPDYKSSHFSDFKNLRDLNFSDIKDYNIKVESAIEEFNSTLNNMLFYKKWKEFQNVTKLDLKKYRKINTLIRPFKIKNFLDSQENNLVLE